MKKIEKINKIKCSFFEKVNKIGKPVARLRKKERIHKVLTPEMKNGTLL